MLAETTLEGLFVLTMAAVLEVPFQRQWFPQGPTQISSVASRHGVRWPWTHVRRVFALLSKAPLLHYCRFKKIYKIYVVVSVLRLGHLTNSMVVCAYDDGSRGRVKNSPLESYGNVQYVSFANHRVNDPSHTFAVFLFSAFGPQYCLTALNLEHTKQTS